MAEKLPINDLKDLFTFGCSLVKATEGVMADKKIDLGDLAQLMTVFPTIGAAYEGIGNVGAQIANLDEAEEKEIIAQVDALLGEGAYEAMGEDLLQMLVHGFSVVAKIKAMSVAA